MSSTDTLWKRLGKVVVPAGSPPVCHTIAEEVCRRHSPNAVLARGGRAGAHSLRVSVGKLPGRAKRPRELPEAWVYFDVGPRGRVELAASAPCYLYAAFAHLTEVGPLPAGQIVEPAFQWQRPVWDLYYAQAARSVRNLGGEGYVRQMARFGFTHLEVNRLAFPEGLESGVPGELYPRFYTYCPALDQFVTSFLNEGIYPRAYLRKNLERLKQSCRAAERYGLIPTITCFEPRSVPEALLARYPELRGARVDHPFRSFKPRYNLAVSHPVVRRHYRELIQNLLREVPGLGCMSIWTNDSGAGFEFTRSLYVGANGSAFLVKEWSEEDIFTGAAAKNVVDFLRLLRESGAEVNPDFRVTTRLEPFGPERDRIVGGLGRGVDVEVPTLLGKGWETPYGHPTYPDAKVWAFTIYNNRFSKKEAQPMRRLARRDCRTHVMYAHGPVNNFEPLLGIPSPWLCWEKLRALKDAGASYLAHFGGVAPPRSVRWNLNEEVFRRFQHDPALDIGATVEAIARDWAGAGRAPALVEAWRLCEEAIRGFMPSALYFSWGVWYRILIRPLVPDIEAIPEDERAYYERHALSTHHNPNRFDLSRDVLFELATPDHARKTVRRIDQHALGSLAAARELLAAETGSGRRVFADQLDRLTALQCWMITRRSVAAWIADVHGYLNSRSKKTQAGCRKRLSAMVAQEIANARQLLQLWEAGRTEFMAVSAGEETTFVYDTRFGDQLREKIRLMQRYRRRAPRIDKDVMWRVANLDPSVC